ncbi:MAG: hypothetical protein HQK87_11995, partial [Nitrospinae bacterium]|nr:hypothetical protein [Nitrospinota bacterium]
AGAKMGVPAHLGALIRLANGPFKLENAVTLDALEKGGPDVTHEKLISLADGLGNLCKATVVGGASERLQRGQAVGVSEVIAFEDREGTDLVRIVSRDGKLLAVAEKSGAPLAGYPFTLLNPKRVLI